MAFILAVSGSRLMELFSWGCSAIEIGSFADKQDYSYVLGECFKRRMQLAIHSPFYREGNRYGLLQGEVDAWSELERDLSVAQRDGLAYVLIHFPYLRETVQCGDLDVIRTAAERIVSLSQKYKTPVLIEPKLGPNCDCSVLRLLRSLSLDELKAWKLAFCLDVGDIYIASKVSDMPYLDMVKHLAPLTRAVHLHDVVIKEDGYFWTPITGQNSVPILETLSLLSNSEREIFLVLEHTPHLVENNEQVLDGIEWLRTQLGLFA